MLTSVISLNTGNKCTVVLGTAFTVSPGNREERRKEGRRKEGGGKERMKEVRKEGTKAGRLPSQDQIRSNGQLWVEADQK